MGRVNSKTKLISYENSIKKSNELSMAKLYQGLTLNQMQLLAYSIFCTQKNGVTEFRKTDFEEKFGVLQYRTEDALKDSDKITSIKFSTVDMENEKFKFWNAFIGMGYDKGLFTFEWSPKMLPHILEVKEKYYVTTDLTIASNFKSSFSWTLYDYLKAHYGCWYKNISKNELMELFGVQDINSYQINTAMFKKRVLDIAIKEINEHTELEVSYKSLKEGRTITGFKIDWSNGTKLTSATKKQINEIKNIVDTSFDNMFQYVDLDNTQDRQRAIDLVRKIEKLRIFTGDDIGITNEKASQLIQTAILDFKRLNHLLEKNNLELSRDTVKKVEFYNWLEDKG
ncbi:replication initiation protein [Planococcus sp. PAMC 21323]|uniref:replication initiation protein n=2 Tax=Planococcus TaxID=1372 RepID=UPI00068A96B9|nr:replication initiation protein [Planococcus sp. PAMC 21323]